ncbi:hypothetical protein FG386_003048 [Cryptosporidium ryanae]|uniref:uncharacterized protein n=1 Tax=Cryptosporidium ryanae TaxID=515981 RepID=UPI00351A9534|nr:hypothetical protein FG386_003048 [Cryptosporidium ryanae]
MGIKNFRFLLLTYSFLLLYLNLCCSELASGEESQPSAQPKDDESHEQTHVAVAQGGSKKTDVSEIKLSQYLTKNVYEVIILELEFKILGLKTLTLTRFWKKRHISSSRMFDFFNKLCTYFEHINDKEHEIHNDPQVSTYVFNDLYIKKKIIPEYFGPLNIPEYQMILFKDVSERLSCKKILSSFVKFILIFETNTALLFHMMLLFILICSFRGFSSELDFKERLIMVLENTEGVGLKFKSIFGNDRFLSLILDISKSGLSTTSPTLFSDKEVNIEYPIVMENIKVSKFGYNYCLSMLELIIEDMLHFEIRLVLLFFSSRMLLASEVLLATEITRFLFRKFSSLRVSFLELVYSDLTFENLRSTFLKLHNINLSTLKLHFSKCLENRDKFEELNLPLLRMTDYQERTKRKTRESRKKRELRGKYPFLLNR